MSDPELSAMKSTFDTLDSLEPDARARVLSWVSSRLDIKGISTKKPDDLADQKIQNSNRNMTFDTFADFYHIAAPTSNATKALVAGYWLQVHKGMDEYRSQAVNKELQNLGHVLGNVTEAFNQLKSKKPALAIQVKKSGKSQQARKTYKLTHTGIKAVEEMLQAESG